MALRDSQGRFIKGSGGRGNPISLKLDGGWARFRRALDPTGFQGALQKHVRRASELNGKLAERAVRQTIKGGGFEKNAPLTVEIKRSEKPLVDKGSGLFQAVTSKVLSWDSVFVGVLATDSFFNIAETLHNGRAIPVSDRMRGMFDALWKASTGQLDPSRLTGAAARLWERKPGGWLPLRAGTTAIILPSRPFFERTFESSEFKAMVKLNWENAVNKAIREVARK